MMMKTVMKRRIRRTAMRTRRKVEKRHAADQQFRPLPFQKQTWLIISSPPTGLTARETESIAPMTGDKRKDK